MVTGAYYPELSGGGLQARTIVRALREDVDFYVLTTTTDASLPSYPSTMESRSDAFTSMSAVSCHAPRRRCV